ncbi:MAG: mannose-1-phosphate guanylyltransferase/mannose-6-phosphate isomerase [Bdellovibrionales bacterium RBG_16_40_8]|nr:MAG: mannose-1-phosphate guanylyltransferase/mannose-6-phosphate isomerase [Bdellovibrionales bacterium RBG_16_40_8]
MIAVILSGGSGSRLWPISRASYPKQFCEFFDQSFLRTTVERLRPFGAPIVVTLESMGALTNSALTGMGLVQENIFLEPIPKNTAAAIALVAQILQHKNLANEVMGVFPADHLIVNVELFRKAATFAEELAQDNHVVTMGITPRYAATGYGYMKVNPTQFSKSQKSLQAYQVEQFIEKPTAEKAEEYTQSKQHYWNAGIFFFKVSRIIELFKTHMPEFWKKIATIKPDLSNLKYVYANLASQSIDYGIMEKLPGQIICVPGDFGWSDVGSWDELARLQEESLKIYSSANVFAINSTENFVYSNHPKVVALGGVEQLIIVDTPDALLVTKRGESQNVRKLVEMMSEARLPQVAEHNFEVRPWGRFEVLADRSDHKVKRLVVDPRCQLSYQVHSKRDEHWTFISGDGEVVLDDKTLSLRQGEQLFIPRESKHRLRNIGPRPLVVIEVQTGEYFGEDDIKRFEDDFNRT